LIDECRSPGARPVTTEAERAETADPAAEAVVYGHSIRVPRVFGGEKGVFSRGVRTVG